MEKTVVQQVIDIVQMDFNNHVEISMSVFLGMLKTAKETEKQQIMKAYSEGVYCNTIGNDNFDDESDYYNKTFSKNV